MNKKRVIFGILSVLIMVVIFLFSAKNAEESSDQSLKVGMTIGKLTIKNFEELPKKQQISFAKKIDHFVRKTAHFTEFMTLGFMLLGFYSAGAEKLRLKHLLLAWITGTLYAVTDEIHQIFVPGRSCQAFDVMIDSSGVLTGVLLMSAVTLVLYYLMRKHKAG
jgi:Predicted integral membrane protein